MAKKEKEMLVVKSKVKDAAKGHNVAGDFVDGLSEKVHELIEAACKRADANGRKTIRKSDL